MSLVAFARTDHGFPDRVWNLLERTDYRLAIKDADRDAIYRLRYDAYLREGAISPSFSRRVSDKYDDLDNAWIFGIYIDGELASSIRLNVASPDHPQLPALGVFSDILVADMNAGKIIIDPTRFVVNRELSRMHPDLRYVTVRLPWIACEYFGADCLLATVRVEHQAFYRRVFGHRAVGAARSYPSLKKPISFMTLDYHEAKDQVPYRYPFFRSNVFERRMLFGDPGALAVQPAEKFRRNASAGQPSTGKVAALVS